MLRFCDSEWKDLIPYIGFCNHVKAGNEKIKDENKKEALSQLQRKGLPKKTAITQQSGALIPIPVYHFSSQCLQTFLICLMTVIQDNIEPDLYELGSIIGLDPEIHEDLQEIEDIRSAIEECAAAEQGVNPDVMDIDEGIESTPAPVLEIPVADLPVSETVSKKRRGYYPKAQLDILEHEFQRGGSQSKNEEIARAISCLDVDG
jgi:hypothetical protein